MRMRSNSTEQKYEKQRHFFLMKLLEEAGCKKTVFLSSKKALAMRTSIGLSWTQHRKQSKFLRKISVKFEGEKLKQRKTQKDNQLAEIKTDKKRLRNGEGDKIDSSLYQEPTRVCIQPS